LNKLMIYGSMGTFPGIIALAFCDQANLFAVPALHRKDDRMPQPSYAYGVARVRVLETKLLSRDRIERMADAPSAGDVLKILAETSYAPLVSELSSPYDYEEMLTREMKRVREFIDEISPDPDMVGLFFLKYDFHNLKVMLKSMYSGSENDALALSDMGTVPIEVLKAGLEAEENKTLPRFMGDAVGQIKEMFTLRIDPQKIDIVLDRAMYDHIFGVCRRKRNSFVTQYFKKQVDLVNLRSLLRAKRLGEDFEFLKRLLIPYGDLDIAYFANAIDQPYESIISTLEYTPYGKLAAEGIQDFLRSGNLTAFERLMDNYLLEYVRAGKHNPFGIEAIAGYLLGKENEIKLIRIIMVGKLNNMPAERIRERLRDVYV